MSLVFFFYAISTSAPFRASNTLASACCIRYRAMLFCAKKKIIDGDITQQFLLAGPLLLLLLLLGNRREHWGPGEQCGHWIRSSGILPGNRQLCSEIQVYYNYLNSLSFFIFSLLFCDSNIELFAGAV
jgi:hypothetical protein